MTEKERLEDLYNFYDRDPKKVFEGFSTGIKEIYQGIIDGLENGDLKKEELPEVIEQIDDLYMETYKLKMDFFILDLAISNSHLNLSS